MKEEDIPDLTKSNEQKITHTIEPDTNEYVVHLLPPEVKVSSQDKKFLDEFLAVVEKNLTDTDFDIETLCKKLCISRATLFRKIPELTGVTPNDFIHAYRLERGAHLLKVNYGNVAEVAEAVGFSDQFYFSKCFKKKFGQPPKQYQLKNSKISEIKSQIVQEGDIKSKGESPQTELLTAFTIETLERELIARGAKLLADLRSFFKDIEAIAQRYNAFKQVIGNYNRKLPLNKKLSNYSDDELLLKLQQMIEDRKAEVRRDRVYTSQRIEFFNISNQWVRMNALAVTAVCMNLDLPPCNSGYYKLRAEIYGQSFKLRKSELFYNQPIAAGLMCSGVLVGEDVIATVAHFANEKNVTSLRFLFDFVMLDPISPVEKIPEANIYKGVQIIERVHNPEGDLTLVKLDRKVTDRTPVKLLQKDIFSEQPVYVLGHPCGLPLKYAPGAQVGNSSDIYFRADLDVYASNNGSPVFCAGTHELIGIVSRPQIPDFRWTREGWITLRYPKTDKGFKATQCSRSSEFKKYLFK